MHTFFIIIKVFATVIAIVSGPWVLMFLAESIAPNSGGFVFVGAMFFVCFSPVFFIRQETNFMTDQLIKLFERLTLGVQYLTVILMLAFIAGQIWKVLQ